MHGLFHEERILMRTFSILCLVAAAIVPLPGYGRSQEINQEALSHFEKALHSQDIQKRIEHYEKALAIEPGFPDALYQLGVAYLYQGAFDKAIETLTRVVPADSAAYADMATHLKDAYTFLAQEYLAEDEIDQALYAIEEALYLDELYSPALAML
ncbi:tetratricopeptide repeat protein, partial [candidate division KSB1 bacterium]|nr:tetratricopeptide repeat protein [candidate division KSB1 bacterium]